MSGNNYPWLDAWCLSKPGSDKHYKDTWDATLYTLAGKLFVLWFEDRHGKTMINLKLEPSYGMALRLEYPDITPGYHMNKLHWVTLRLDGTVPDELVRDIVDESYRIILRSLPKKTQRAIEAGNA